MNYQCDLCLSIECITQWYVKIYISCPKSALSLQIYSVNLISQRQVVSCKNKNEIMVVVSDLGPPEEGVRHTQPAVATYVNRFRNLAFEEAGWQDVFWSGSRWAWARSTSLRQGCPGLASRERYSCSDKKESKVILTSTTIALAGIQSGIQTHCDACCVPRSHSVPPGVPLPHDRLIEAVMNYANILDHIWLVMSSDNSWYQMCGWWTRKALRCPLQTQAGTTIARMRLVLSVSTLRWM